MPTVSRDLTPAEVEALAASLGLSPTPEDLVEGEVRVVDRLVGNDPPVVVRVPGRLLGGGEPAAAARVGEDLADPPPVLSEPVVRPGRG